MSSSCVLKKPNEDDIFKMPLFSAIIRNDIHFRIQKIPPTVSESHSEEFQF